MLLCLAFPINKIVLNSSNNRNLCTLRWFNKKFQYHTKLICFFFIFFLQVNLHLIDGDSRLQVRHRYYYYSFLVIIVVIIIIVISILLIRCLWSFFPCLLYELLLTRNRLLISLYNRTTIFILSPCSVTLFISVLCRFYSFTLNILSKKLRRNYRCFDT